MFYLLTVTTGVVLITLGNFFGGSERQLADAVELLFLTLLGVAAVFIVDAVMALIARRLPERWFLPEARLFAVGKRERSFYRWTRINTWKKYVPEWGCFTGFHKDKLQDASDSAYLGRFLLESNYGVAGHVAGALAGYLILLIPVLPTLTVALPVAAINMLLSLLPTMVLRYNTAPLRRLYRRSVERKANQQEKTVTA